MAYEIQLLNMQGRVDDTDRPSWGWSTDALELADAAVIDAAQTSRLRAEALSPATTVGANSSHLGRVDLSVAAHPLSEVDS